MTNAEARREYESWREYFNSIKITRTYQQDGFTVQEGYGEDGHMVLFHEKREGSMVSWMIEEYAFYDPYPEMPRFVFEEKGEFVEGLPSEREWMIEYDFVNGKAMRIMVVRDIDRARDFAIKVGGKVNGMTPITESRQDREYFAITF